MADLYLMRDGMETYIVYILGSNSNGSRWPYDARTLKKIQSYNQNVDFKKINYPIPLSFERGKFVMSSDIPGPPKLVWVDGEPWLLYYTKRGWADDQGSTISVKIDKIEDILIPQYFNSTGSERILPINLPTMRELEQPQTEDLSSEFSGLKTEIGKVSGDLQSLAGTIGKWKQGKLSQRSLEDLISVLIGRLYEKSGGILPADIDYNGETIKIVDYSAIPQSEIVSITSDPLLEPFACSHRNKKGICSIIVKTRDGKSYLCRAQEKKNENGIVSYLVEGK